MASVNDEDRRIAEATEQKLGLPAGVLGAVLRARPDVTTMAAREALDNFGVDAKLSRRNAIEVAGLTLMTALERNKGDQGLALAEYLEGPDRAKWGGGTQRFVATVLGSVPSAVPPAEAMTAEPAGSRRSGRGLSMPPLAEADPSTDPTGSRRSGRGVTGTPEPMPAAAMPQPAGESLEDLDALLPRVTAQMQPPQPPASPALATSAQAPSAAPPAGEAEADLAPMIGPKTLAAYQDGTLPWEKRQKVESFVRRGAMRLPDGVALGETKTPGIVDRAGDAVKEAVTGEKRTTPEIEAASDVMLMPEFIQLATAVGEKPGVLMQGADAITGGMAGIAAGVARGLGTIQASPQELAGMLKANFPGMEITQDTKGNYLFKSSNGKTYGVAPGLQPSDAVRGAAAGVAFLPAGRAASIGGAIAANAATQGVIELAQAERGGTVDAKEIALAGGLGGAFPAVAQAARGVRSAVRTMRGGAPAAVAADIAQDATQTATRTVPTATRTVSDDATQTATRTAADLGDMPPPRGPPPPVDVPPGAAPPPPPSRPPDDEMASLLLRAGRGDVGAKERLAGMVDVNADDLEAFKVLGIENVPVDVVSDNPQMRALAGLVRGKVGTAAEAEMGGFVGETLRKADDAIAAFDAQLVDGVPAPGVTSDRVLDALKSQQAALKTQTDDLYREIDKAVPKTTGVRLDNARSLLRDIRREVTDDRLSAAERSLVRLTDDPAATYGALMRAKNEIGAALARQASPFADVDQATLKRLYGALAQDQVDNVGRVGGDQMRQALRRANVLTGTKKRLEERMVGAFGKDLEGSIGPLLQRSIKEAGAGAGGRKAFEQVMALVPPELQREAVATALAANFRKSVGGGGSVFDLAGYAAKYDALRANPAVYSRIVKALGGEDADKVLRSLYTVSKRVTEARGAVKTTGKANQEAFEQAIAASGGLIEGILSSSVGRGVVTGAAAAKLGPLGAAAMPAMTAALTSARSRATAAAADLFTSPEFRELAIGMAKGAAPTPREIRKVTISAAFRAFAKEAKIPRDQAGREQYLSALIQAARQTRPRGDDQ
jgi:hypothetical protein